MLLKNVFVLEDMNETQQTLTLEEKLQRNLQMRRKAQDAQEYAARFKASKRAQPNEQVRVTTRSPLISLPRMPTRMPTRRESLLFISGLLVILCVVLGITGFYKKSENGSNQNTGIYIGLIAFTVFVSTIGIYNS